MSTARELNAKITVPSYVIMLGALILFFSIPPIIGWQPMVDILNNKMIAYTATGIGIILIVGSFYYIVVIIKSHARNQR